MYDRLYLSQICYHMLDLIVAREIVFWVAQQYSLVLPLILFFRMIAHKQLDCQFGVSINREARVLLERILQMFNSLDRYCHRSNVQPGPLGHDTQRALLVHTVLGHLHLLGPKLQYIV